MPRESRSESEANIRLQRLPVNQAYAFTFGDAILEMDGQRLFANKQEASRAARSRGLIVNVDGTLSIA